MVYPWAFDIYSLIHCTILFGKNNDDDAPVAVPVAPCYEKLKDRLPLVLLDRLNWVALKNFQQPRGISWYELGTTGTAMALKRRLERLSCLLELNHVQTNKNEFKKYKFNIAT
ncbi:unnamed protein product [Rhizophagus irregularis]|nr:unnamed protein product [Rhizophagus irregularis]